MRKSEGNSSVIFEERLSGVARMLRRPERVMNFGKTGVRNTGTPNFSPGHPLALPSPSESQADHSKDREANFAVRLTCGCPHPLAPCVPPSLCGKAVRRIRRAEPAKRIPPLIYTDGSWRNRLRRFRPTQIKGGRRAARQGHPLSLALRAAIALRQIAGREQKGQEESEHRSEQVALADRERAHLGLHGTSHRECGAGTDAVRRSKKRCGKCGKSCAAPGRQALHCRRSVQCVQGEDCRLQTHSRK